MKLLYDPDKVPTKTLTELSAEFPDLVGLRQLASAEQMENPPPQLEGLRPFLYLNASKRKPSE